MQQARIESFIYIWKCYKYSTTNAFTIPYAKYKIHMRFIKVKMHTRNLLLIRLEVKINKKGTVDLLRGQKVIGKLLHVYLQLEMQQAYYKRPSYKWNDHKEDTAEIHKTYKETKKVKPMRLEEKLHKTKYDECIWSLKCNKRGRNDLLTGGNGDTSRIFNDYKQKQNNT